MKNTDNKVMTGRDLIVYILTNRLEDEPMYEDGRLLGFITAEEAAVKFKVDTPTIRIWVELGMLHGIRMNDTLYIPELDTPTVSRGKSD